ncbi:MAG: hypothetical protein RLY16_2132 [Bacteroidota bacterium]|jgi:hypothetical protein
MKYAIAFLLAAGLVSCQDSFLKHTIAFEKAGACDDRDRPIKMLSNISGERYEFFECVPVGFTGKEYHIDRKGDSLIVVFDEKKGPKEMLKHTLDLDVKPAYHHLLVNGTDIMVVPYQ